PPSPTSAATSAIRAWPTASPGSAPPRAKAQVSWTSAQIVRPARASPGAVGRHRSRPPKFPSMSGELAEDGVEGDSRMLTARRRDSKEPAPTPDLSDSPAPLLDSAARHRSPDRLDDPAPVVTAAAVGPP